MEKLNVFATKYFQIILWSIVLILNIIAFNWSAVISTAMVIVLLYSIQQYSRLVKESRKLVKESQELINRSIELVRKQDIIIDDNTQLLKNISKTLKDLKL